MTIATIFFGMLMEILQYAFTTVRSGDALDAVANTIGSILGALAMKFYFSSKIGVKWNF